ncbi:ATP-dependent DNA ligase [Microbacterium sp. M3]|uniref:DNA ligase (ATP) n=1 Tax=Microbacterium arthrosphaerae TaxID=792652 RepID=A0ABU4H551_9MICO|nr:MULTISPECIES: ATP-dependent DNA ligase [Microbacterium]MDW4574451.1 ATP-dependent DNA ligase [Microbacterium arthrosphaerae]MDW7608306.1 ATP-dependent DNA ligase [Microbacterium sp. M3]
MPYEIPAPMLAKSVPDVPDPAKVPGGLTFEPKWDGFRALISWDGENVEIGSRGAKPLTRYFPELVEAFARLIPEPCLLDGEIVVPVERDGRRRLDWESLSQRIHPAASRVNMLAEQTPAMFIAFDLLAVGDRDLQHEPFATRRAALVELLRDVPDPVHVTRTTDDPELGRRWLAEFEGAGLDGVVAKPLDQPYAPGKRTMFKIKHARTADVVALGYRIHKSGQGVGSLLVGLYGEDGTLYPVGGVAAWSNARRLELIDELAPLVQRDAEGEALRGAGEPSRFQSGRADSSFVKLRPERVLEVRYDQLEGWRFRHTVQFERWRPDRDPRSCTYEQLEVVAAYDLADVLV